MRFMDKKYKQFFDLTEKSDSDDLLVRVEKIENEIERINEILTGRLYRKDV